MAARDERARPLGSVFNFSKAFCKYISLTAIDASIASVFDFLNDWFKLFLRCLAVNQFKLIL